MRNQHALTAPLHNMAATAWLATVCIGTEFKTYNVGKNSVTRRKGPVAVPTDTLATNRSAQVTGWPLFGC